MLLTYDAEFLLSDKIECWIFILILKKKIII
jgi:hypothetical protein